MSRDKLLNILLVTFFIALAITVTYGVQFYRAVQKIEAIDNPECYL